MAKILIVDDDKGIRRTLREILEFEKYTVTEACDGLDALVKVKQDTFDVIIMDIKMPKLDGMEAIERMQNISPDTPVVMISGHGNIDTAVEAVKKGAFDEAEAEKRFQAWMTEKEQKIQAKKLLPPVATLEVMIQRLVPVVC